MGDGRTPGDIPSLPPAFKGLKLHLKTLFTTDLDVLI